MKNPEEEKHEKEHPADKGIVQPMIDELRPSRQHTEIEPDPTRGPLHPPEPAELDQDPGGGYNRDHTIPQP